MASGAPIEAPTALDDIQIYAGALTVSQLQEIRSAYTNKGVSFPARDNPSGCTNEDICAAGLHDNVELQIPDCVGDCATAAQVICDGL